MDSVFRALWLATQSVNILHYSLIHLQFLRARDATSTSVNNCYLSYSIYHNIRLVAFNLVVSLYWFWSPTAADIIIIITIIIIIIIIIINTIIIYYYYYYYIF